MLFEACWSRGTPPPPPKEYFDPDTHVNLMLTLLVEVLAKALLVGVSGAEFSMAALLQPTTYSSRNMTSISGWGTSSVISREPYNQGSKFNNNYQPSPRIRHYIYYSHIVSSGRVYFRGGGHGVLTPPSPWKLAFPIFNMGFPPLDLHLPPPPPTLEICYLFAPSWIKSWNKPCSGMALTYMYVYDHSHNWYMYTMYLYMTATNLEDEIAS
jgi:hypothetical protein